MSELGKQAGSMLRELDRIKDSAGVDRPAADYAAYPRQDTQQTESVWQPQQE